MINDAAGEYSLHVAHADILVLNFLINEVSCPDFDAVVVNCNKLGVRVVIEANLICSVGSYGIAT